MRTNLTMRTKHCMSLLLLPLLGVAPLSPVAPHGEYVEARTGSVFAGACHYNGERVTEGRSALLAWNVAGGSFDGTDLGGVRVMAAIACDDNLAERGAARRSILVVDADSDAKAMSAVAWVKASCGEQLGTVVGVRRDAVQFTRGSDTFTVVAPGFASLAVRAMPDRACCTQPELVWYQPLMPISDRRVGYTQAARLEGSAVGTSWQRSDENSSFYGRFAR